MLDLSRAGGRKAHFFECAEGLALQCIVPSAGSRWLLSGSALFDAKSEHFVHQIRENPRKYENIHGNLAFFKPQWRAQQPHSTPKAHHSSPIAAPAGRQIESTRANARVYIQKVENTRVRARVYLRRTLNFAIE